MQVFLPYRDFYLCSKCLDNRRLLKQILECKQILNALKNGGPWSNHCITRTWRGYEHWLESYKNYCILEAFFRKIGKFEPRFVDSLVTPYRYLPGHCYLPNSHPPLPKDYFTRYQWHLLHKNKDHYSKVFSYEGKGEAPSGYYALDKTCTAWKLYSTQV